MTDSRIPQRKKRRWQQQAVNPPFPVPIATITGLPVGEKNWHYFTGELEGDHVVVNHSGDIAFLHKMGFFGRGLMSQGAPDFYKRLPNVFIPQEDGVPCPYKVARRRMFLRHNQWRKSHDQQPTNEEATCSEQDTEYDSDIAYEPVYYDDRGHPGLDPTVRVDPQNDLDLKQQGQGEGHEDTWTGSHEYDTDWGPSISGTKQGNIDDERIEIGDQSENSALWDANDIGNRSRTVASWEADGEGDADFWGCEDTDQSQQVGARSSTKSSSKQDLLQHSNDLCDGDDISANEMKSDNKILDDLRTNKQDCLTQSNETDLSSPLRNQLKSASKYNETNMGEMPKVLNSGDTICNAKDFRTKTGNKIEDDCIRNDYDIAEKGDDSKQNNFRDQQSKNMNEVSPDYSKSINENIGDFEMSDTNQEVSSKETANENVAVTNNEYESREIAPPKLHPYCDTEDNDADYLVIYDSDTEAERGLRPVKQPDQVWKPVLKRDPFPIQEPLILSLEEAFFLSYGLGCLTVVDSDKVPLTLCDLWQRCCKVKVKFLPHYVAYHYFRSKGWVPKPGLLFGADFILYRIGPPFFHGSYSVIVRPVHEGSLTDVEKYTDRKLTWTTFCGLHRVTEHVAKALMLCYVIIPDSLTEEYTKSPECLSKFKVKLQVINRWISSQERGKEPEQIP